MEQFNRGSDYGHVPGLVSGGRGCNEDEQRSKHLSLLEIRSKHRSGRSLFQVKCNLVTGRSKIVFIAIEDFVHAFRVSHIERHIHFPPPCCRSCLIVGCDRSFVRPSYGVPLRASSKLAVLKRKRCSRAPQQMQRHISIESEPLTSSRYSYWYRTMSPPHRLHSICPPRMLKGCDVRSLCVTAAS